MFRTIRFLVVLGLFAAAAVWLVDNPGSVTLTWRGYRLDTSFAVLLGAVAFIACASAVLYRLWNFIRRSPSDLSRMWREGRRRRGFIALTRGLVAVAAGDADEAERQSRRAEALLDDPPLTMLLSAQAAQLGGDEQAAGKFFNSMRDQSETEFLGLRGLLTQAMKRRDWDEASGLARRAYRLRPKSEWVAANLIDLQTRTGSWADALATLEDAVDNKLVTRADGIRRRAVLEHQMSIDAGGRGDVSGALKFVRRAHDLAAEFIPASVRLGRLLAEDGKLRRAKGVIEAAWRNKPHPAMVQVYGTAHQAADAMSRVRAAQSLAKFNPDHVESRIAVAKASLEAKLWGEARKHLTAVSDGEATARVCRLMAELEELENNDLTSSREWLMRASLAEPDPVWVCEHCGNAVEEWSALCGKCEHFDSFNWRAPSHIASLPSSGSGPTPMALLATEAEPGKESG